MERPDEAEIKNRLRVGPLLDHAYSRCSQIYGMNEEPSEKGTCHSEAKPQLQRSLGLPGGSDIIKFILLMKPQHRKGWARVTWQV